VNAAVIALRPDVDDDARPAIVAAKRYLARCSLAANTTKAYGRQIDAYGRWLAAHAGDHPDAFADVVGAEGAVTAWKRHLLRTKAKASTVNQALAAVTLLYEHAGLRIQIKRVRVDRPGEPDALSPRKQAHLERTALRRGGRDAAIIATLLYTGARVEECARLDVEDVSITPRTGTIHLLGKGDQPREVPIPPPARAVLTGWLDLGGRHPGPLWISQRSQRLSISGITQVVLAVGADASLEGLRPHRLRHTYATRLRQAGVDVAQVQALMGHASLDTAGRYFRAGPAELAEAVDRTFE
jgi:site-specific recombinase XerD